MSEKKGPVILIAAIFLGLILVPVFIFFGPGLGGDGGRPGEVDHNGRVQVPSDLNDLAQQARTLVNDRLADALRRGDISLERIGNYNRQLQRAEDALNRGRERQAREGFEQLITEAGAELERFALADDAIAAETAVADKLRELAPLENIFANGYRAARSTYETGRSALGRSAYQSALDAFEEAKERLAELAERGRAQVEQHLEAGDAALAAYALDDARAAYRKAREIDANNARAQAGLDQIAALAGIEQEVAAIDLLIKDGRLDAALRSTQRLLESRPDNAFLQERKRSLERQIRERNFVNLLAEADAAEERGDLVAAINALEAALEIRADSELVERLRRVVEERRQIQLETILASAFEQLRSANYAAARDLYREALTIDSNSSEAKQGLERAARLLIAEVEFRENLEAAARTAETGRYPLAATFFNRAMATRPSNLPETDRERSLRRTLDQQSEKVTVTIRSDNRTFVSIIGVLPPEQFRTKELSVFPDVYKVRGTRRGANDVELELRVDAREGPKEITVINR